MLPNDIINAKFRVDSYTPPHEIYFIDIKFKSTKHPPTCNNRLLHGLHLIWVLSTSDTYHITNEWAQRTSEWCDMCHELIKSISKCNPCYNLFITYHIHGIVRMYQWVRNAILACLMITYDTVNGLFCAMHVRPRILFTLRLRCFLNILWWL